MASALKSTLGGGSNVGPYGEAAPSTHSGGHSLIHNLLQDAVNTARGLPMGLVETAKHPEASIKAIGHSYADLYGHGWHHFAQEFHAHPLQPLLDAISVPLMLAGGAGAVVKGASAAADLGEHGAEYAAAVERASELRNAGDYAAADKAMQEVSRAPRLKAAAQHFQADTSHTTRFYDTGQGFSLPKAYSTNMFRRFMTQGTDAVLEGLVGKRVGFFSAAGKGKRLLAADISRREAASAGRAFGQALVTRGAEKAGIAPELTGHALQNNFEKVALATTHDVPLSKAENMSGRDYTYIAADTRHEAPFVERGKGFVGTGGEKRVNIHDAQTGEHLGHVDEATADELSRAGARVPQRDRVQFEMSRPADSLPRDEEALVTKGSEFTQTKMKQPFVAHPAREVPTGLPKVRDKTLGGYEDKQVKEFIQTLGGRFKYTDDPAKALVDEHGNVKLMRRYQVDAMRKEVDGSLELAKKVYFAPLQVWKGMILAQSPRYFVNNVIGNAGMYAAATDPVEFTRGFLGAVKSTFGIRKAARMEREAGNTLDALMAKHLPEDFVHEQFGFLQHGALSLGRTVEKGRTPFGRRHILTPLYGITEKVAYRGPQRASIMGALSSMEGFRTLMRANMKAGMNEFEATQASARTLLQSPGMRAAVEKRVTDWAGQYYHLNDLERNLTALVPFYNWTRHALRFGKEQVLSRPVQSAVMAQIGALGDKDAKKELGNLPDFLKGAIPVGGHSGGVLGFLFGQNLAGRKKVILTSGYNPLASAADDARAVAAVFGGGNAREAIGGQLNPIVSGAIAGVTGQQLFSGAKAPYHGPLEGALSETFGNLPQTRLLKAVGMGPPSQKTKRGEPTLYAKDVRQQLSSILGLNERDFSPKAAEKLYRSQEGIKKGRRHARKTAQGLGSNMKSNL